MEISIVDYAVGAAVGTDLVSTSPTVRGAAGDAIPGPDGLTRFLAERDVRLDAAGARADEADVFQVHLLRREVRGVLETETEEQAVAGGTVLAGRAGRGPVLRRVGGAWQWFVPTVPGAPLADELAALIGIGLLGTVKTLGHERFRACAAPDCRGVFADTSRAGRRRYCMPDLCGNRLNVANHRARRQAGSDPMGAAR
ncbi:CGNR zinc finger domain-containing protein [Actinomadura litoris]|uniref:CGNR zinc finger domain-containing protein n=1 Tax=Actinomadura litoris TaxID=2678616 RepID=UPI001FA7BDB7|nr:CGNR zinc finger domain-containing protein [Actinomadura litoris]